MARAKDKKRARRREGEKREALPTPQLQIRSMMEENGEAFTVEEGNGVGHDKEQDTLEGRNDLEGENQQGGDDEGPVSEGEGAVIDDDARDDDDDDDHDDEDDADADEDDDDDDDDDDFDEDGEDEEDHEDGKERLKEEARRYREEIENRGVVYLSSLPPYMKPAKVRHLLGQHGPVTRIHFVEEDASARKRRIKAGGKRKKMYVEAWIEYQNKKDASFVAKNVNGTLVGGKKRNFYHDDMWCIKYLKGFKWAHLTEKLEYERRVRQQKMRVEMVQAKKENALFAQLVDKKKMIDAIESRKRKRQGDDKDEGGSGPKPDKRIIRKFRQVAPISEDGTRSKSTVNKRLLSQVFKKAEEDRLYRDVCAASDAAKE